MLVGTAEGVGGWDSSAGVNSPSAPPAPLRTRSGRAASALWTLDGSVRHLNHGSFGAVPAAATAAQRRWQDAMHASPVEFFAAAPERIGHARGAVAGFLGVAADEVAFVANASAAASAVWSSIELPPTSDIVVTEHGYGAVTAGARRAASRAGGTVTVAPVELHATPAEAVAAVMAACTARTSVLLIDQITSPTALRLPAAEIVRAARKRGITTVVDAAHAPLLEPRPVPDGAGRPDVWFGNLHKFGCAPPGSAVLLAREPLASRLFPLIDSWGWALPFPERFDHQGTIDSTSWLSAATAFGELENEFGWDRIRSYTTTLADWAAQVIARALAEQSDVAPLVTPELAIGPMRLVALPTGLAATNDDANALRDECLRRLRIETAFTSFRGRGYLRLSAHAYNSAEDYLDFVERAVPWLAEISGDGRRRPPTLSTEGES